MPAETIKLRGHIIDSLILPKELDEIITHGGSFKISEIKVGEKRTDQSSARIEVTAPSAEALDDLILRLRQHGAEAVEKRSVQLAAAPADGVFPQEFYVTTNQQTFVRLDNREVEVEPALMDSAIVVDRAARKATATKFDGVKKGMEVIVGHQGIRVVPRQRSTSRADVFEFLASNVSIEKPKSALIAEMAREFRRAREEKGKILVVAGPAIVHTGAAEHFAKLIEWGYVNLLYAGNALAAHDIENVLYGKTIGVPLERGALSEKGHQNHLSAINAIRGAGGIKAAVKSGLLKSANKHASVKNNLPFVLAGSNRDDGPLPEVITDSVEAQKAMRAKIGGVTIALMMGTMLHSLAVRNLLPASVKTLCVDLNPAVVSKLADRGAFQTAGLVTDIEAFLRELTDCLGAAR
jgi:lysine-ketoglutarate reductase/saccharopine dehydrogenase-like protein (TIGR00300 family)